MDNAGGVVRVGDTVRRPIKRGEPAAAVHAFLLHLEHVGFEGAPRYLGIDSHGREVLSFIEGDVPLPPFPAWSMTDDALASVGRLLRHFHDAAASFDPRSVEGWMTTWADPVGSDVVCHNDPYPENIVFRRGEAVALLDFDLAAPGRRLWDVAIAAREWCPLSAPRRRHRHPQGLDGIARLRLLADGYGVGSGDASMLLVLIRLARQRALTHIRDEIAAGNPMWIQQWNQTDGDRRTADDEAWLDRHGPELLAALLD
jgi:hypothetical protein